MARGVTLEPCSVALALTDGGLSRGGVRWISDIKDTNAGSGGEGLRQPSTWRWTTTRGSGYESNAHVVGEGRSEAARLQR